jgi:S1-C subfamily serine protease
MRPGDVVTGVNRAPVRDLDEFRDLVSEVRGTLYLEVLRKGRDYVVRLD